MRQGILHSAHESGMARTNRALAPGPAPRKQKKRERAEARSLL